MFDLTNPIYSDVGAACEHLEALHWPNGPVCPRCGETERLKRASGKSTRPGVINCNACRKPFTGTVGTIFEDSKIPLNKWLMGFRLMAGSKKGISAHQLHRSPGITYKSAWFMAHRIREAMDIDPGPLGARTRLSRSTRRMSAARPRTAPLTWKCDRPADRRHPRTSESHRFELRCARPGQAIHSALHDRLDDVRP